MKAKTRVIILLIVSVLLLAGCGQQAAVGSVADNMPTITHPLPCLELQESGDSLPAEIRLNTSGETPERMPVYKMVPNDNAAIQMMLSAYLGIAESDFADEGDQLIYSTEEGLYAAIDKQSGTWSINYPSERDLTNLSEPVMDDAQAIQKAKTVMQEFGVDLADYTNIKLTHTSDDIPPETGQPMEGGCTGYDIWFYPEFDGCQVYGISRLNVALSANGDVCRIMMNSAQINDYGMAPLKTLQQAFESIRGDSVNTMVTDIFDFVSIDINEFELAYYADVHCIKSNPYVQPVYYFKGTGITKDGSEESFGVMVPALDESITIAAQ